MLTLKLGQLNIPMIVTNHTYDVIGSYVPTKEMKSTVSILRKFNHLSQKRKKRMEQKSLEILLFQDKQSRV